MGVGRRKLAPLWVLALALACAQHTGQAHDGSAEPGYEYLDLPSVHQGPGGDPLRGVTILSSLRTTPVMRAANPAHNGRVCSTWGDFHYKTFDGDVFRFPGLCNYVFSAHCSAAYEDFNVQLRRGRASNATMLNRVVMKLDGMVVELTNSSVLVNGRLIQLPFSQSGVLIEHSSSYVKVVARLGLVFMWNQDDSLLLELDAKYANQTCGLCGDFNGVPVFNEFFSHNVKLTPMEFGNLQKLDGPTEQCQDPIPVSLVNCSTGLGLCEEILSSRPFSGCNALVDASSYVEACHQDLCLCEQDNLTSCICHTLAEYSRQCAHAGGLPQDWRGPDLCPLTCPLNMRYHECGSPCSDTCSNREHSQLCEDHCVAGCFCPEGMVLDDIGQTGCIPESHCSCVYNGATYAPGATYSTDCTNCTCSGGQWSCQEVPCPGTCSVLGGTHFSTFDERLYTVHGDCTYVLAKPCNSSAFTVLADLRKCGLTDSETCLKSLTLSLGGGHTVIVIKASGEVFVNQIYTQLPVSAANITLFRPSTFFIIAQTNLDLQLDVQLVPTMQVFVRLAPALQGLTCGLCGNFNQNQADDFRTLSGVVEGTAAAFVNTWKTQAACPNVKNSFEDPCSLSVENEKYAQHWCSRLTDPHGSFSGCHSAVSPSTYYANCMFDTCNCEKSEACMCAALSSYVRACAAKGVLLSDWRDGVCAKPTTTCPKSMTYQYNISTCQPTCRARSEEDVTCGISFVTVDGCACPHDTFLDDTGKCVPATSCPCYLGGSVVPNGESLHESGAICTCTQGRLTCIGGHVPTSVCASPMVYFDCRNATAGASGAGCQKSCHTLDMDCYSSQCVSGCVCPHGLVADGQGGCIAAADCPCVHNDASYQAGETIRVGCNTCTCKNRVWQCTDEPCLATCAVYGDGHYLTFDGQRYSFSGDCEYTLVQDHCSRNSSTQEAFRVVTENVPCGTTGTTCSKAIKIFLGSYELKLSDGKAEVIRKGAGQEVPYSIRQMGIYLVVDTDVGLLLLWDMKTSIFIRLSPEFKGRVCGLCGNFDDNAVNDFTTRSQSVVGNALEFGNSWKFSPSCPDASAPKDPCTANPYRKSWAQKQCSIINSATFAACHAHVEPAKYYEACVSDACACDSGGDCECFCTAVAAYAQACHEVGVCVSWRTPSICPLFCDYYNPEGLCEWHYLPCGAPCLRTCQNPRGQCLHDVSGLEGCYPKCPAEAPLFDEDQMRCVATCPQLPCHVQGKSYRPGAVVPLDENCQSCVCTESGVQCTYDAEACVCTYDGRRFRLGDVIYHTTDGTGGCISARCGANGTIDRRVYTCSSTTPAPQTTFSFSTSPLVVSSTRPPGTHPSPTESTLSSAPPTTVGTSARPTPSTASASPLPDCEDCQWSQWMEVSRLGRGNDSGDFDPLEKLRAHGYQVCQAPRAVQCRAEAAPEVPLQVLGQRVECSPVVGLTCHNRDQASGLCDNYQIRILCCSPLACPTSGGPAQTTPPATSRTTETGPTPGTSRVTSVPTGSTASPAFVSTAGPTTLSITSKTPYPYTCPSYLYNSPTYPYFCPRYLYTCPRYLYHSPTYPYTCPSYHYNSPRYPYTCPTYLYNSPRYLYTCPRYLYNNTRYPYAWPTYLYNSPRYPYTCPRYLYNSSTYLYKSPSSVSTKALGSSEVPGKPTSPEPTNICLQQSCNWTQWIDGSYPGPGRNSGDFDTLQNLRSKGYKFCEKPSNVQCRAESFPDIPLEELGQDVICNTEVGLLCLNKDQLPPICYNYEIRIECCETVDVCRGRTTPPATPETTHSTPHSTGATTQGSGTTAIPSISTKHTRASSAPGLPTTEVAASTPTVTTPETTACRPQCKWTKWFDVELPSPGPQGGENETYSNILRSGERICHRPEYITHLECRAESRPEVSIDQLGQVVQCDPDVGLVCRNQDQEGLDGVCLNYEIRVLCCEPREDCTTQTPVTHPSTSSVSIHSHETTSHVATSRATTLPETSPTSVQETSKTSVPRMSTTTVPGTSLTSVPGTSLTSVHETSRTSVPRLSTTTVPGTSPTSGAKTSRTSITHSPPMTNKCRPRCNWTKWFDVELPSPGPQGGENETYSNILRSGERLCHRPEYITHLECRAESRPEVSIDQLGQVVQCDPDVGLVCRNQDQEGPDRECLNYEIRVLCCEPREDCTTQTPVTHPSTSSVSIHSHETTSHVAMSRTTTLPETSPTSVQGTSPTSEETTKTTSVPGTSPTSVQETSRTSVPRLRTTTGPGTTPTSNQPDLFAWNQQDLCARDQPDFGNQQDLCAETEHNHGARNQPNLCARNEPNLCARNKQNLCAETELNHGETSSTAVHRPGTTSAPIISTTSVPAPEITHSPPVTNKCRPRCNWTKWFDVELPSPGPQGGENETYSNILRSGERICHRPEYITHLECRAESRPEVSIDQLGQVVKCDPDVGLVCRNQDQEGQDRACLNYEIRVLCCEPREDCTTQTPVTHPSTSSVSTRSHKTTSHVATFRTTTLPETSPTSVTSMPATSPTSVQETSRTSVPRLSTTTVPGTSPTSVPGTSLTSVHETSRTSVPGTSPISVPSTSPTSEERTRTTSVPRTSTTSVQETSRTSNNPNLCAGNQQNLCAKTEHNHSAWNQPNLCAQDQQDPCAKNKPNLCAGNQQNLCAKTEHNYLAWNQCNLCAGNPQNLCAETENNHGNQQNLCAKTEHNHSACNQPNLCPRNKADHCARSQQDLCAETEQNHSACNQPCLCATHQPDLFPAPETTHSPPVTNKCRPSCNWSKWFDVELPSPGPQGGENETYSNILRSGERICHRPEYITHLECRAESHSEVSTDQLGQVVKCDPDVGLVCRNQDQEGPDRACLNYEIRVLCCEPREDCTTQTPVTHPSTWSVSTRSHETTSHVASSRTISVLQTSPTSGPGTSPTSLQETSRTSVTPHVTSSTNRSPPPQSTSLASTVKSLSSPASSPSTCYCNISQKIYPAGSTIYQQTDLDGHCYSAVCSLDCHVVRWSNDTCPTSVSPPAPSTSSPGSSPSAPVPDTKHGCSKFVPPRTKGETWNTPNCTQTTCEGNNVTTVRPRQCPKQQEPTCANGYPAVKVVDQDGCCPHYQCQCVCSGWGDPHYITFDGTYYTFLDNCTYVLVQQIVPVYGHFRVLIDNYFCNAEDGLSCPQSIIVEYQQDRVVLTRKPVRGVMTNEIIFNGKVVSPGFQKDGIEVSQIGIKMYVIIPAIGVQVMFSGLIFSVEVPFSKFANNTEGQCGTCTNDPKDECRLPGGEVVSSCSEMSGHWKVPNPDQPYCYGPPPTPTSTPSPASCPPSPICQLILSEVFEPCHSVISPKPFYQGCVFDQCHVPDLDVVCSGLELYASLCASHGVCIDWRGQTNHMCPFTCPADKVYRPCGPSNPSHCYGNDSISLLALQDTGPVTEGCFCPESMTLFSTSVDVCVPTGCPRCLGPHGEPVEPGHNVSIDCQECTCNGSTWRMSCRSQPCPPPPTCSAPGLVPVPAAPEAGQCCPHYSCVCNSSHCPAPLDCPKGSRLILTYEEGACCPRQNCSWTVCSVNGTLYQPGTVVSSNLCETCRCEVPGGAQSDTFVISCETQICNTYCPVGFEYQARSGQCCGVCVQVACFMNASDSSVHLFYPGKSWSDPGDPCVTYECEKYQDGLVVVTTKKACPQLTCPSDQARLSEDGCCLSCPPPQPQTSLACTVHEKHEVIQQQGCNSSGPVRLAYCRGNCGDTTSMYSLEANAVERSCMCCQELRVLLRNVTLHCADGSSRAFSYPQVEECGCVGLHCDSHGDRSEELRPVQSRAEQSQEREQTRQRRGARGPGPHQ
ncbi:PREDICTED: mucin-5AC [Ceratotherium simum simum]|uniref:Mucin-5AC n=1 Tax=Ceratotherium simum simum TaxID=73337 RepID=A0ABM1DHD4_CERSS|nr:PREDICTED: mucin-5AC [Ceratotherium simum simum]